MLISETDSNIIVGELFDRIIGSLCMLWYVTCNYINIVVVSLFVIFFQ